MPVDFLGIGCLLKTGIIGSATGQKNVLVEQEDTLVDG